MTRTTRLAGALALAFLLPAIASADPLHPIARDAYWHHESNFIFPATLGGFTRVGAPQEVDGSTTVTAYYALGTGEARRVVQVSVAPVDGEPAPAATYSVDRGGWRVTVRSDLLAEDARIEGLVEALPLPRLGQIDTRCPNPGCGD